MKCPAFDHTAVDNLRDPPSKSLLWDKVHKYGTIFSDVVDFYDFLRRVADIKATMKQSFIVRSPNEAVSLIQSSQLCGKTVLF